MTKHESFPPPAARQALVLVEEAIKALTTRELLAAIVGLHEEEMSRGTLADAPLELTKRLEDGQQAAREALEWLSKEMAA